MDGREALSSNNDGDGYAGADEPTCLIQLLVRLHPPSASVPVQRYPARPPQTAP
jgi:hypothetical protein